MWTKWRSWQDGMQISRGTLYFPRRLLAKLGVEDDRVAFDDFKI